jgi:2-polyprenyl-3-methyl-5-hydroxy-6-metoxy-1,4-benzoquinol methylase
MSLNATNANARARSAVGSRRSAGEPDTRVLSARPSVLSTESSALSSEYSAFSIQHSAFAEDGAERLDVCLICGSAALSRYCEAPSLYHRGETIRYERCGGCGTVLRNPRPAAGRRLAQYEDQVPGARATRLDPRNQAHYRFMMRLVRRYRTPAAGMRLLDFGCGAGGFLLEARAAGFEVMGLELNRALAAHVTAAHGIPVFQGLADDPRFAGERFSVIVSSEVFEHLLDPRQTLAALRAHLPAGGLLLIEVPNLRHLRERLARGSTMDDAHLFYFTAGSLTRMLRASGFRILEVHEGLRPYRFLPALADRVPVSLLTAAQRLLAALQIKTGLSVLGRLE